MIYRESSNGSSWGAGSRATEGPNAFQSPVGVTRTDAVVVTFLTFDTVNETIDILSRRASE